MFELLLHGLAIFLEIVVNYVLYLTGWLVLRLLTLGRYPNLPLRVGDPMGSRTAWVAAFGFFCLVGLPLAWLTATYS
ncbi:hypothetical protein [Pseudomonas sp.]|uniref:hypothetical protein n=1 Tax=Pseudomonas sp. TaxID=306 RepID=UPI003A96E6F0